MKILNFVLSVAAIVAILSAATEKASLTEGFRKGDLAPKMDIAGGATFANDSGKYTLVHFWATYDAYSRMQNVRLWNSRKRNDLPQVRIISISLDENESVFRETLRTDGLEAVGQMQEKQGVHSATYRKYGLKRGLKNFLIDDRGVIVAVNVAHDKLKEQLKQ
jgi:thiol-disulfide isomerase/thioredoxin